MYPEIVEPTSSPVNSPEKRAKHIPFKTKVVLLSGALVVLLGGFIVLMLNHHESDLKTPEQYVYTPSPYELGGFVQKTTFTVGSLGTRTFYRTNFLEQTIPTYTRQKRVSQGVYDAQSKKTYIVYGGGLASIADYSDIFTATDPYIIAFNHTTKSWEGPVKLGSLDDMIPPSDGHNYPQVVIDKSGYVHVFHTFHGDDRDIAHFTSKQAGSITNGFTRSTIPDTQSNTYGAAYVDTQGDIYVFYRKGVGGNDKIFDDGSHASGYCGQDQEESHLRYYVVYEPEQYVKSTDNGATWSAPQMLIDPEAPESYLDELENWRTVYTEDFYLDKPRNRIGITFKINAHHNCWTSTRSFIFFNMATDTISSANGTSYGTTLSPSEYDTQNCCTYMQGNPDNKVNRIHVVNDLGNHDIQPNQAITIDPSTAQPTIYFNWFEESNDSDWIRYFIEAKWTGDAWAYSDLNGEFEEEVYTVLDGVHNTTGIDLYVKMKVDGLAPMDFCSGEDPAWPESLCYRNPLYLYNYTPAQGWRALPLYQDHPEYEIRGVSYFGLIPNSNSSIQALFIKPQFDEIHQKTSPGGTWYNLYALGTINLIGTTKLNAVTRDTTCTIPACTSWTSMRINECTYEKWSPTLTEACKTSSSRVWLNSAVTGATLMRFINVPNSNTYCSTVNESDTGWSDWEDYSDYRYWLLSSGTGSKKVCVQYKNSCEEQSPICGGMIERI